MPKLPAAGTRPSSILARTPDSLLRRLSTRFALLHSSFRTCGIRTRGTEPAPMLPQPASSWTASCLPTGTPVSPPRAIDPRVFCRPIRARARAKPGDGGRSLQVFELLHGDLSRVNLRLNAVDQGDAVVVRGDDRAVRTDRHVRDELAARTGKVPRRRAQRFQDLICHVVFSLQIHCTADRGRDSSKVRPAARF